MCLGEDFFGVNLLGTLELHIPECPNHAPDLGSFQPLYLEISFLLFPFSLFCYFYNVYMVLLYGIL